MKFSDRSAAERTAIDGWIRVAIMAREKQCLEVADDFRQVRRQSISESSEEIEKMLRYYSAFQTGRYQVSYAEYFQVSNPEEYASILCSEKNYP